MSSERWRFSEYLTDDGVGTITLWMGSLDDEVQAQIDVRLLQWKSTDKWIDAYAGKFEDLKDLKEIAVLWGGSVYRILGSAFSIWEFVMLIGDTDNQKRNKVAQNVKVEADRRLNDLRAHPEKRREYKTD
jgi:hypothetical protein